ncbi:MAG: NAD-dependent epimerase [Micavibrio sp.]|nr:NAD-dependent epimerase [Micavibrio sp.]|tara:strand:- start:610 stop:1524 length:915 start_codon:yes stop_codon:yes gene_type:complete
MARKNETVLLTGASGFLGSYTAEALTQAGYHVKLFDRVESPYLCADQEMIIGDITDLEAVKAAAQDCDYIYHMAGIADIEECKTRPLDTGRVNLMGTLNALEAAVAHNIKRFVFASTVYVYSERGSFYRASKQACENYIETYKSVHALPFTILRYGSLYGRRAPETNGIHKLITSAMEKGEIVYYGDENAMREYIHISDAAQLSVDILAPEYENRHIILTGNERMRVTDIMRMIAEMLPNKPALKFGEEVMAGHYVMTPYNYNPRLGQKLVKPDHIELGQGILDCIDEIAHELSGEKRVGDRYE